MTGLLHYDFPYNVRELEACVKRAIALADGPTLDVPLLPEPIREEMSDYGAGAFRRRARHAPYAHITRRRRTRPSFAPCYRTMLGTSRQSGARSARHGCRFTAGSNATAIDLDEYRAAQAAQATHADNTDTDD